MQHENARRPTKPASSSSSGHERPKPRKSDGGYRRKSFSESTSTGAKPTERRRRSSNNSEYKNKKIDALLKKLEDTTLDYNEKLKLIPDTVRCLDRTTDLSTKRAQLCAEFLCNSDPGPENDNGDAERWSRTICEAGLSKCHNTMTNIQFQQGFSGMAYDAWLNFWITILAAADGSVDTADHLVKDDIMQISMDLLRRKEFRPEQLSNDDAEVAAEVVIGVIYCCLRQQGLEAKKRARDAGILKVMLPYLKCDVQIIRVKASICMAYVINEEEMRMIDAEDDVINMLVNNILKPAVIECKYADRKEEGLTAEETARALNALAKHDNNKRTMIEFDLVSLYFKMLEDDFSIGEVATASEGLWLLTFVSEGVEAVKSQPEARQKLLRDLVDAKDANPKASQSATGVLFNLKQANESTAVVEAKKAKKSTSNHVMISYNWGHKEIARSVSKELQAANFNTWLDIEQMHGSTLDAMAAAVENAAAVVMFWSEKYQDSINCRAEAEYAFKLNRPIIPVRVENYKPTGWLNMLLGSKLYIVCEHENQVSQKVPEIVRNVQAAIKEEDDSITGSKTSTAAATSNLSTVTSDGELSKWSTAQVQTWLDENKMGMLKKKLGDFDGELLCKYRQMNRDNPQLFFDTAHRFLGIKKFSHVLRLASKLEKI